MHMKIEQSTPQDQLLKSVKHFRAGFWWCLVFGILCIPGNPPAAVVLIGLAVFFALRRKKAMKTIQQKCEQPATRVPIVSDDLKARAAAAEAAWQQFLDENELVRTIHTKVVGVTFRNADGSSRQENLSYCTSGGTISFEPFTYKGAPAYAVYCGGLQIGNLPADLSRDLYDLPDSYTFFGDIDEVTGGDDGLKYGCNLVITLYRKK